MLQIVLLFAGAFLAALLSGAAGFGGALLLLPLLVSSVGTEQAVPLLTVAQLIGNLSRAGFGFSKISWKPVGIFLIAAIPAAVAGAFSFVQLSKSTSTRIIGAVILFFVILKLSGIVKFRPGKGLLLAGGIGVGFLSGLTGSAGPLGAMIFLTLNLPPVSYIASEAVTALGMHTVKLIIYQQFITLDRHFWIMAVCLGGMMILGTWVAKKIIEKIDAMKFQRIISLMLIAIGLYMLIVG